MKKTYLHFKTVVLASLILLAGGFVALREAGYRVGLFQRLPLLEIRAVDDDLVDTEDVPEFTRSTGQSLDANTTIAVLCQAPKEILNRYENINFDLAKYAAFRMNENNVVTVPPNQVIAWLQENDWRRVEEIGDAFKTTYVLCIDLDEFSLYEEGNATSYRGQSKSKIAVWKMNKDGTGRKIFSTEKDSRFPILSDVTVSEEDPLSFKGRYLARLSSEIAALFFVPQ